MGLSYPIPAAIARRRQQQTYPLYIAALDRYWLQQLVTATDERPAFVSHALSWLKLVIGNADHGGRLDDVRAGAPERLSKAQMLAVTGEGPSQVHRYRTFLADQKLISVTPGSWDSGSKAYAALYHVHLDAIAAPLLEQRALAAEQRRNTVGEPARERAKRLEREAEDSAAAIADWETDHPPGPAPPLPEPDRGPHRAGMSPGQLTNSSTRTRAQSNRHANRAPRVRMPLGQSSEVPDRTRPERAPYDLPSADDLALIAPLVDAYRSHERCPPRRRFLTGAAAICCAGDAQAARVAASLIVRDGIPQQHLVDAIRAECDDHDPKPDKRRSKYIDSLSRFLSTLERAAKAWSNPNAAKADGNKRQLVELLNRLDKPMGSQLGRELANAGLSVAIMNSADLRATLRSFCANWWASDTDDAVDRAISRLLQASPNRNQTA